MRKFIPGIMLGLGLGATTLGAVSYGLNKPKEFQDAVSDPVTLGTRTYDGINLGNTADIFSDSYNHLVNLNLDEIPTEFRRWNIRYEGPLSGKTPLQDQRHYASATQDGWEMWNYAMDGLEAQDINAVGLTGGGLAALLFGLTGLLARRKENQPTNDNNSSNTQ